MSFDSFFLQQKGLVASFRRTSSKHFNSESNAECGNKSGGQEKFCTATFNNAKKNEQFQFARKICLTATISVSTENEMLDKNSRKRKKKNAWQ